MKQQFKRVTALGLGLAMTGGLVAACNPVENSESEPPVSEAHGHEQADASHGHGHADASAPAAVGEGGEGEGGVAIVDAGSDPVVFISALAVAEAHVIAAREAHVLGHIDEAGEMFAHPASEVLFDMEETFNDRGVTLFDAQFTEASMGVFNGETSEQVSARADALIATLRAAAERAPDDGSSQARIWAGVAADQIDRAVDMYRIAQDSEQYGPYLDGFGFYKAGVAAFEKEQASIEAELPEAAARIREAFAMLEQAYPDASPQESLPMNRADLNAVSTQAGLALRP